MVILMIAFAAMVLPAESGYRANPSVTPLPILSDWYIVFPRSKRLSLIAEQFLEFVLKKGPDVLPMENLERQVERALARV